MCDQRVGKQPPPSGPRPGTSNDEQQVEPQPDPLYAQARQILQAQPEIGKARLAALLGVKTPTSRRLRERWRGETQGHSTHPDYVRVQQLKQIHLSGARSKWRRRWA